MKARKNKILFKGKHALVLFSATLFLFACSAEKLQKLEHFVVPPIVDTGVEVNFCTDPAQVVISKLKYVVVLDHSGSNVTNYKVDPATGDPDISTGSLDIRNSYGTDPLKTSRYGDTTIPGSLLSFLDQTPANNPADPSVYFALFTFSGSYNQYPTTNVFTSDVRDFENRVAYTKANTADQGPTNYLDTLRGVQSLIQADINLARACSQMSVGTPPTSSCLTPGKAVSSSYIIVFMSDGAPITQVTITPTLAVTRQPSREVLGTVAGIMGLQANTRFVDSINLFTIYYYQPINPDPFASKLLEDMATVGNGVSYNVTSGANIDYRRFTPPSRLIKFSLADIFVTNASVVVGADGLPELDTDMDGIPDSQELILGSAIDKADSDGNGVGDLVEATANSGQPCGGKNASGKCVKNGSTVNYGSGICAAVPRTSVSGNTVFQSSDPNGLNDCEKLVLNDQAGINNPDSNADFIPDWLQFKNGVPFQIGTVSAKDTQDVDSVSYYQKIKTSLPALTPYYRILAPKPALYDMKIMSSDANQDCYQLTVQDLPMAGDNNMVRVDVVLRSPLLQDRFLYRVGKKRFDGSSKRITFYDWSDATEAAANTWRLWP